MPIITLPLSTFQQLLIATLTLEICSVTTVAYTDLDLSHTPHLSPRQNVLKHDPQNTAIYDYLPVNLKLRTTQTFPATIIWDHKRTFQSSEHHQPIFLMLDEQQVDRI